jgi:hypothetical protein
MIFVMSLFAPSAMADNRIAQANRAVAKDCPSANFEPNRLRVVLPAEGPAL